jgi:predicted transcriptional regulator
MGKAPEVAQGKLLTEVELELMRILWRIGQGTVREVMAALPKQRDLAYTSVSTMLRILEQKGFVRVLSASGRSHVYAPTVAKPQYESRNLRHLVGRLFEGNPASLVRRLVDATPLSDDDLRDLRDLLDERLKK